MLNKTKTLLLTAAIVAASGPAMAQAAGGTFGSRFSAWGTELQQLGSPLTYLLFIIGLLLLIAGAIALSKLGKRNEGGSVGSVLALFAAGFILIGMGGWATLGSNLMTGRNPSVTGASAAPLTFN